RRRAGRAKAEGDAALGVGAARDRCRGAAVRPAGQRRGPGGRRRLPRAHESEFARDRAAREARALRRRRPRRRALPVRAPRIFLRRPRLDRGSAGVQSHGHAEGCVGEGGGPGIVATQQPIGGTMRRFNLALILLALTIPALAQPAPATLTWIRYY